MKSKPVLKKLTRREEQVLELISPPICKTNREIANLLDVSTSRIRNINASLRKKGYLNVANRPQLSTIPSMTVGVTKVRGGSRDGVIKRGFSLHALVYDIKLLRLGSTFKSKFKKGNSIYHWDAFIQIHEASITVHLNKEFIGNSVDHCDQLASDYLIKFLFSLENRLNAQLVREGYFNIKRVRNEYARINDGMSQPLAEDFNNRVLVFGSKDGKLWFSTDKSGDWHDEVHHPVNARRDMKEVINPFLNDLRDNVEHRANKLTTLLSLVEANSGHINEVVKSLEIIVKLGSNGKEEKKGFVPGSYEAYIR